MLDLVRGIGDAPALVDGDSGESVTHAQLRTRVTARREALSALEGRVVLLGVRPRIESVVDYLALTGAGATVALLDPAADVDRLSAWVDAYRPAATIGFDRTVDATGGGRSAAARLPDRVLLPTSGTTGSPKFVRLSEANVVANAEQIVTALRIAPGDRALCYLPLFYSYGLSVLNSHLLAGATVVVTTASSVRPEFLRTLVEREVTTLPGVPFSFGVFDRLRLFDRELPHLRHVTVAGGALARDTIVTLSDRLRERGADFWTMYGQTEATARISVLPPDELPERAGSVGWAVPGATVTITDPDAAGVGEIVVEGPNVMLGYATSRDDVGAGDVLGGRLHTGDLGRVDAQGRLWVTGRIRRIAKVSGLRVSLDDIEATLADLGCAAALDGGDTVTVVVEGSSVEHGLQRRMERAAGLPPDSVRVVAVADLPRLSSGKVDHASLGHLLEGPD